jgi:serine phosphatase RsbU (regulator of sigma subunit)/anti-sigma regulatory factor (Ser/Thr protein kinase)
VQHEPDASHSSPDQLAAQEIVLVAEPGAASRARRFIAQSLSDAGGVARDDAELAGGELVTNAVLHGRGPITVRLYEVSGRLRLEVEDAGPGVPVLGRHNNNESLTGRGLALVAALATSWGVQPAPGGGKVVWVELGQNQNRSATTPQPEIDVDALLASWADVDDGPRFTVRLGSVSTALLLSAKAHIDNLVRECNLATFSDKADAKDVAGFTQLARTIAQSLSWARAEIKRQALDAASRGDAGTDLVLRLPASAADAGERYLAALDQADAYARAGDLLTLESPHLHRVFRRWYVTALIDQLRAAAAGNQCPQSPTFQQRLADEVTTLAALQQSADRLRLLQTLTAELTGARTVADIAGTVVSNATRALGARSAAIYLLTDDGMLRSAAVGGVVAQTAPKYGQVPVTADLPGPLAVRTGETVSFRNVAELSRRFPHLSGVYTDDRSLHVAPLIVDGQCIGVLSMTFRARSTIDESTQHEFLAALADASAQALQRALATARAEVARDRLAFLAEASVVLSESVDFRATLAAVAGLVVPRLADWCVIQLVRDGELDTVGLRHFDPAKQTWAESVSGRYPSDMNALNGPPNVIRTGLSELYRDITDEMLVAAAVDDAHLEMTRSLGMSSALIVPLTGSTGTFGAITMIYAESGRRYDDQDVALAEDLARRCALAVETAHAFLEQSGRLAQVSRVAEAAQHAILAAPPERVGPVALAARYVSAAAEALIGGDMYEVVARSGAVRLLIGDARGKGLNAVRTATVVLGEFRAAAADLDDLGEAAMQIDRRLRPYLGDEDFVTALLAEIRDDGTFAVASCGHPPALLVTAGAVTPVTTMATPPLGLGATPTLTTGRLRVGDRLLLYTDGIIEARDQRREFVDLMSLVPPLLVAELDVVLDEVLNRLHAAVGGALDDDLALVVAEYRGSRPVQIPQSRIASTVVAAVQ